MKGLLIKDFRLLKGQKQFFGAVLIVTVLFLTTNTSFLFVISYITVMTGMLTLTTISYDEYENGMGYLFTLPISRKVYVREKYLFGIMTTMPAFAAVSAMAFLVSRARHIDFTVEDWAGAALGSILVVMMMLSFMIPIELKFGVERSRVAIMIVFGGSFLVICAAAKVFKFLGVDWKMWVNRLDRLNSAVILAVFIVGCGVILAVSYLFSLRFMVKREF